MEADDFHQVTNGYALLTSDPSSKDIHALTISLFTL